MARERAACGCSAVLAMMALMMVVEHAAPLDVFRDRVVRMTALSLVRGASWAVSDGVLVG